MVLIVARSAAFSGRSSGVFLRLEESERRKSPRSRDLELPIFRIIPTLIRRTRDPFGSRDSPLGIPSASQHPGPPDLAGAPILGRSVLR
jgi:hypothetical protein